MLMYNELVFKDIVVCDSLPHPWFVYNGCTQGTHFSQVTLHKHLPHLPVGVFHCLALYMERFLPNTSPKGPFFFLFR